MEPEKGRAGSGVQLLIQHTWYVLLNQIPHQNETRKDQHPGRLTWNLKMMVWKMIFLFNWVIFRSHVNLPGWSAFFFRIFLEPCFPTELAPCEFGGRDFSTRELWFSLSWTLNQELSRKIRWYRDTFHERVNSKSLHKREDASGTMFSMWMCFKLSASCGSIQAAVQLWISTSSSFSSKMAVGNGPGGSGCHYPKPACWFSVDPFVYLMKPIGSMWLLYLPTWMVDFYGKRG